MNIGASLDNKIPGFGEISFKGGIKALYMDSTQFGPTAGIGIKMNYLSNRTITIDYAYKTMGLLGDVHAYSIGLSF